VQEFLMKRAEGKAGLDAIPQAAKPAAPETVPEIVQVTK